MRVSIKRMALLAALVGLLSGLLAACAENTKPESSIETYLKSLVAKDDDKYFSTICPAWEADAQLERDAYWAVTAELDGVSCAQTGKEGNTILVTCEGQIVLNYEGETRERPLNVFTYLVEKHDGDWKMCGYR